ncbi:uncharacterized protein LOC129594962 [Paramacrobiotus metropolitanus]|uniref:uncharacterized protein LOC129594962 n=1 Tax=Paramacrobiotus metropolitanus TaxID=2943436 RepID=UPI0024457649|nr:uncharacterized protein LOC129594962 [Paramacrobiotus metropolitanus]
MYNTKSNPPEILLQRRINMHRYFCCGAKCHCCINNKCPREILACFRRTTNSNVINARQTMASKEAHCLVLSLLVLLISVHLSVQDSALMTCMCPLALCAQRACIPASLATSSAGAQISPVGGGGGACNCNSNCGTCPIVDPLPGNICQTVLCAVNCQRANPVNPTSTAQCCICSGVAG